MRIYWSDFNPSCRHCGKNFFLGFGFRRHCLKEHNIKITKKDKAFMWRRRLFFVLTPLFFLLQGIQWLLIFICAPFHFLYELLTSLV